MIPSHFVYLLCYYATLSWPPTYAIENLYTYSTSSAGSSMAWGGYCYDKIAHVPTCGWKMSLLSDTAITSITMYENSNVRISDHNYQLVNDQINEDLTYKSGLCSSLTFFGDFGGVKPIIALSLSEICNDTDGLKSVPYLTLEEVLTAMAIQQTTATTATTAVATTATTATPAVETPATTATVAVGTPAPTRTITSVPSAPRLSGNTQIRLVKVKGKCYIGNDLRTIPLIHSDSNDRESCGASCVGHLDCHGINFIEEGSSCQEVIQSKAEMDAGDLQFRAGCQYWEVTFRDGLGLFV